jgi:hypothetical protein
MKHNLFRMTSLVLVVLLIIGAMGITALAVETRQVTVLEAAYGSGQITVSGQTTPDVLAVAVMVYDRDGTTLLRLETFGVADGAFSAVIALSLSSGTYTVKAADYAGGVYAATTFRVASSSSSSDAATPTPTPTPVPQVSLAGTGTSVAVTAEVTGNTATLSMEPAAVTQALGAGNTATLSLDVRSLGAEVQRVSLSGEVASLLAESVEPGSAEGVALEITFTDASVRFDAGALNTMAENIEAGDRLEINVAKVPVDTLPAAQQNLVPQDAIVLDLSVIITNAASGKSREVHEFAGEVTVRVPYVPAEGEDPDNVALYYIDAAGVVTKLDCAYNAETKQLEFTTNHFSLYTLSREYVATFSDVKLGDWFYPAMNGAGREGLLKGTTATTLSPEALTNRAMLVTVLYRREGSPAATVMSSAMFRDVAAQAWYADAVAWAAGNKLVVGYGDGRFGPQDVLTREQLATILYRYAQMKGTSTLVTPLPDRYRDVDRIAPYAATAMQWAVSNGVLTGVSADSLLPKGQATRAQLAAVVMRLAE